MPSWTILRRQTSRNPRSDNGKPKRHSTAGDQNSTASKLASVREWFNRTKVQDRRRSTGVVGDEKGQNADGEVQPSSVASPIEPPLADASASKPETRPSHAGVGNSSFINSYHSTPSDPLPIASPLIANVDGAQSGSSLITITGVTTAQDTPDLALVSSVPHLEFAMDKSPLDDAAIEKLFSGAPQFFARSLGHGSGAPHPSVAFPWDEELGIRDLTDHNHIEHDAWGSVTASPRIIIRDPKTPLSPSGRARPHFNSRTTERPNMVSFTGLEKGTMGYQAALELSVADSLQEEQYGFDSIGKKGPVILEQRKNLITSRTGLRRLDDAAILEQLLKLEERYHDDSAEHHLSSTQLNHELFTKLLYPPARNIDRNDPQSLAVQIYALVKVLAAPNAWIDFSHVEWRIRLGQLLWGFPLDDELDDGSSINEGDNAIDRNEERYWLLYQILLACELLLRLDAITEGDECGGLTKLKAADVHRFDKEANASVKWSLILARSWLENITITKTRLNNSGTSTPKGWLTSLTAKMHLSGSHHSDHPQNRHNDPSEYAYGIKGKYTERQLSGLLQFAKKLRWPDTDAYSVKMSEKASILSDATPINTPIPTTDTQRSSYFDGPRPSTDSRREIIRRRRIGAALHANGWLTKSYLSGLVLPGEVLSHLLMSTLLENDTHAMSKLGLMANLCGGFTYGGKSFWSTACVVGRVLAAGSGSVECMGWISSDVRPQGFGDGWFNVEAADIPEDMINTGKRARIWGKKQIERESDVTGDSDPAEVMPADFIVPSENAYLSPPPSNVRIVLKFLDLSSQLESVQQTPASEYVATPFSFTSTKTQDIISSSASMSFTVSHDGMQGEVDTKVSLTNDVNFVTAYPCRPSSKVRLFRSPTSPTIRQIDIHKSGDFMSASTPSHITGHPLHKYYTFKAIHLLDLLDRRNSSLEEILSGDDVKSDGIPVANEAASVKKSPRFLVIDCITGVTPPMRSSPEMASLSRMSSMSSSFALDAPITPQLTATPAGLRRQPSTASRTSSNSNGNGTPETKFERIDPPNSTSLPGTRRKDFGSDMEMFIRALCVEKGWNAVISRKRRGCLACAIREAGALGWKIILRVE